MGQKLNVVEDVLNHPDDEAKIKTVFKKFDKDNSGYLSEDEFNKFVHEVNSTLALGEEDNVLMFLRDFKQVDSNQDGQVEFSELKSAIQKMKKSFYLKEQ